MKRLLSALIPITAAVLSAQTTTTPSTAPAKPEGTVVSKKHVEAEVQPKPKKVKVTPDLIRGAQAKLSAMGYDAGPASGTMTARTRTAIRQFQSHEKLKLTGELDEPTLTKLNVGGTNMMTSAPADMGRGAVAAGHNVKEGHPIAAGKAMGKGAGRFGKKVGQGTKALVVGTKDKLVGKKPKEEHKDSSEPK
jgi:peptidoglycan hydrolase-like protein with peptidoglycan-binding domain